MKDSISDGQTSTDSSTRLERWSIRWTRLRSMRSNPVAAWRLVLVLLGIAVVFAVGGIVGFETGWARVKKDNFEPKSNTYVAILQSVLEDDPEEAADIPVGLLDLIAPTLPNGTISLDIKLGWYKRHSELRLHSDDLPPTILAFLASPSLDEYGSLIDEVVVEKKIVRVQMYKESNVGGQCTGAIVMAALSISILLSLSVFITYMLSCASKIQAKAEHSHYGYYMVRSGTIIGLLVLSACIAHYIALAYGTRNDTRESPYVQRGFIPWPSWAWACGMLSAAVWIIIGIMSMKGMPPQPANAQGDSRKLQVERKATSSDVTWV